MLQLFINIKVQVCYKNLDKKSLKLKSKVTDCCLNIEMKYALNFKNAENDFNTKSNPTNVHIS